MVTPSKPPPLYEQLLPLPTSCFKLFLERSLNDPPPPHFKHPSLLHCYPLPIHHPFPPKHFDHTQMKILHILKTRLDLECSSPIFNKHTICKISHNTDRIDTRSVSRGLCLRYSCSTRECRTLHWSTPGSISFSNIPDCVIFLFSECSIVLIRTMQTLLEGIGCKMQQMSVIAL